MGAVLFHLLQKCTHFQWIVAPWTHSSLIQDLPSLQHVQPLRQSTILNSSDIGHFIHNQWAQGVLLKQDACCR